MSQIIEAKERLWLPLWRKAISDWLIRFAAVFVTCPHSGQRPPCCVGRRLQSVETEAELAAHHVTTRAEDGAEVKDGEDCEEEREEPVRDVEGVNGAG